MAWVGNQSTAIATNLPRQSRGWRAVTSDEELIQHELEPVEASLRDHPYLHALEQGQIPKERLGVFVDEQHTTIESDLRSLAAMVARCDHPSSRRFFLSILLGEDAAFGALHDLATALGLDGPGSRHTNQTQSP